MLERVDQEVLVLLSHLQRSLLHSWQNSLQLKEEEDLLQIYRNREFLVAGLLKVLLEMTMALSDHQLTIRDAVGAISTLLVLV